MAKKTFITKEDLLLYHDETAKKLKTSLKKVLDNIGDINIAEKISELEESIEYSAVLGLQYDENTNTTTFIKGTSAGNVKLNELYIKRDGLYKPLSEIIGGIKSFDTFPYTTEFIGSINADSAEFAYNLYADTIYIKRNKGEYYETYDIFNELNNKASFFEFNASQDWYHSVYIILDLNNDILNGIIYIDPEYIRIEDPCKDGDFNYFIDNKLLKHVKARSNPGASSKAIEKIAYADVNIFKSTVNKNESLDSEFNLQLLISKNMCLMYYTASSATINRRPYMRTSKSFNATIYGDFIFSLNYVYSSETGSETIKTGPYISLVKNNSAINEVTDESDRPVTSYAVFSAIDNVYTDMADTYVSKTAHEESEQTIVNIKKLLYNLTTRVDALDLDNVSLSTAEEVATLTYSNNNVKNLAPNDKNIVINRYGSKNTDYIIIFDESNEFVKSFKIGLNLIFNKSTFTKCLGTTILDIYRFKSVVSTVPKYYYCICVSSDVAKYFASSASSNTLTLYLLPDNLPSAPTVSITDVTQTSAILSWKDSIGSTGTNILIKQGAQLIREIDTSSYISTTQTRTLTGLMYNTTYTVEIAAKLNTWKSNPNTKTFKTNQKVYPDPVYIYMPNATTNSLTRIRRKEEPEFFTDNATELFANGIIYTDNKFNSEEILNGLYTKYGLNISLNNGEEYGEDDEPLPNRIITSDDKFTLLIQPGYNGKKIEDFNYNIRLDIYESFKGNKQACSTGYLSNKIIPLDPTKFDGEILYDNSVITPRTVEVLGIVYDFYENDVHLQILKVRWKYPADFNDYTRTLGIYRKDDETPVDAGNGDTSSSEEKTYENYNLFQNKPIDDIFYTVIIKGFKNTLFHFEINKPNEIYYDKTFVYRFNVCSINRFIRNIDITMNKNTFETDPDGKLTAYNSKNVQNILVQYSDFKTNKFYKILPAAPVFYNIPDTYRHKQYIIECTNIEECAIKGKYFDLYYDSAKPMYENNSGQYLTIYFTYGLNDLYAYFGNSYSWIENDGDFIAAVDTFNETLNNMGIDSLILSDGGAHYDPNIELLFPKISIKLNPTIPLGSDDEIDFFTYLDYSEYYKKRYKSTDKGIWDTLAGAGSEYAIRITSDESMSIDDQYRYAVRPGIFSLTFDIACIELITGISIDRIDIIVDFNMNDRITPPDPFGEAIRPQRIILNGIHTLIQGLQ